MYRKSFERSCWQIILAVLAFVLTSCAAQPRPATVSEDAIILASFDFPESVALAEIYAGALERGGFEVERRLNIASREIVEPALEQDEVDFVPEYLGTVLEFVTDGVAVAGPNPRESHRRLSDALRSRGLVALDYAPAENHNVIVVREETAARHGLVTISDLAGVDNRLVFGGPPECPERPLCLKGLERAYGLRFASFLPLDSGGPVTLAALEGREIDVALLFSTDPNIDDPELRLLADDRDLQPAENVLPIVRSEVIERHGTEFVGLVNSVTHELTTGALRGLNEQMTEGATPRTAAIEWLDDRGF